MELYEYELIHIANKLGIKVQQIDYWAELPRTTVVIAMQLQITCFSLTRELFYK